MNWIVVNVNIVKKHFGLLTKTYIVIKVARKIDQMLTPLKKFQINV